MDSISRSREEEDKRLARAVELKRQELQDLEARVREEEPRSAIPRGRPAGLPGDARRGGAARRGLCGPKTPSSPAALSQGLRAGADSLLCSRISPQLDGGGAKCKWNCVDPSEKTRGKAHTTQTRNSKVRLPAIIARDSLPGIFSL